MASSDRPTFARRLNNLIAPFAPGLALKREIATAQRAVLVQRAAHYDGVGSGPRGKDFRKNRSDAIEAMRAARGPMSWIARDMLRNNPRVVKIRRQLVNNVIGGGIQPSVVWKGDNADDPRRKTVEGLIKSHCLTTNFDADGMHTLLGMQGLGFGSTVVDGEILLRRRYRRIADGFPLNYQVQALEGDYLNENVDGPLPNGGYAVQGIEFNRIGRRVAYHLFTEHPGGRQRHTMKSTRVDARNVIHLFDAQRAGGVRGVSWLAPVITLLHDLHRYQDSQVKRQEIASLFAGILSTDKDSSELQDELGGLSAGGILQLARDETMEFTNPPAVDGYEPFMRATDRTIAAAMGITYEAFTGDYSNVNYTSGRMGRMDVDPNVKDWQGNLIVPRVCHPFGDWTKEAIEDVADIPGDLYEIGWTPPVRPVVDPTKDFKADETAMRTGQKSRRQVMRERGQNPDEIEAEILAERQWANEQGLVFTSDAAVPASGGSAQTVKDEGDNDDDA